MELISMFWIDGMSYDQQESAGMFDRLFKNAAYDRTGYMVKRTCKKKLGLYETG